MVRSALRVCLESQSIKVIGEASNGIDATKLIRTLDPDIAVLDYLMPQLNGIETARELLREHLHTRIIILSMRGEERLVLEALKAGARGYVLKTEALENLAEAIRSVAGGGVYVSPTLAHVVVDACVGKAPISTPALTARERQVLQLIAEGHSTKGIAGLLGISVKTAESHRSRIIEKLDIHETAGLVRYAIREGLTQA